MAQPPKREPLLCDLLLSEAVQRAHREVRYPKAFLSGAREGLQLAKKFVLDEEAAQWCGQMLRKMPRIVADAQDFAIPPFENTWIEMPFKPFYEAVTGLRPDDTADTRVGYLVRGPVAYVGAMSTPDRAYPGMDAGWMPVRYRLNHAPDAGFERALVQTLGLPDFSLDMLYWGESYSSLVGDKETESLRVLRSSHAVEPMMLDAPELSEQQQLDSWWARIARSNGDLRNIVGLLLFLNRTVDLQVQRDVGFGHRMMRGKLGVLAAHRVIGLSLDPLPRLLKLCAGEGVWRRLHDVRGHLCHNKMARTSGCQHPDWEEYEPLKWRCPQCKGLRWWRREHSRGHAEKGVVASSYSVTR